MYPRAGAYIISVKQSTYCQFGEVIRAHTERGEGARGRDRSAEREGGGKGRREMAEEIREGAEECKEQQKMRVHFKCYLKEEKSAFLRAG